MRLHYSRRKSTRIVVHSVTVSVELLNVNKIYFRQRFKYDTLTASINRVFLSGLSPNIENAFRFLLRNFSQFKDISNLPTLKYRVLLILNSKVTLLDVTIKISYQTVNNPPAIRTKTVINIVTIEQILVQTTSCVASCSSLFISPAIIALDTATGVPNRAISVG